MKDVNIPASGDICPCDVGPFRRIARCNEDTDGMNLHYDICDTCGFKTYAHNDMEEKLKRFRKWSRCQVGANTETRLQREKDGKYLLLGAIAIILKVIT